MARQGRPVGLIIAVIAVGAAAALVWVLMKSGDDDPAAAPPQQVAGSAASPRTRTGEAGETGQAGDRPSLPQVTATDGRSGSADDRPPATETIVNGVRVRDHRRDRSKPITSVAPRPLPAHARKIPPTLTAEISNRILPIVRECAANVPPEARGEKPRVQGDVVIAIKNQQVQISQATIAVSDVVGAPVEATKQCIAQKALGVTAPAPDEADLESYPIRLSYTLP